MKYDALVVGLGGMGSAVLAHCAARGLRVAGLERFGPVHSHGASHGGSRIIRQAYFEGAAYVPLLRRAYDLWDELERRTGRTLRARTGGLFVGTPDRAVVNATLASARAHGLPHDVLDAAQVRRCYPHLRPRSDEIAVFEAVAGVLFPERCVVAHLEAAIADGACARFGCVVDGWDVTAHGSVAVRVGEETLEARKVVLCAGAWLETLAHDLGVPLSIERNVQFWFAPMAPSEVGPDRLPVFALERAEWPFMLYGIPDFGDGVKCAFHHSGTFVDHIPLDGAVADAEVDPIRDALRAWLPAATGPLRRASSCTYTLTPDEHFVIGLHPQARQVVIAGGFSGHGFKFCSVVGEIVADLVTEGGTRHDIAMFAPTRFAR